MSVSYIKERIKVILWGKAGGRCQYDGCNKCLYEESLTKAEFNLAYIAHIVADKPNGPRGDAILSPKLKADISNLMLMCDEHHRLIDKEDVNGHQVDLLCQMKKKHEGRIKLLTSIKEDKRTNVILYGANIGLQGSPLTFDAAKLGMIPYRFPNGKSIDLGLKNIAMSDKEQNYWSIQDVNLISLFERKVKIHRDDISIKHYSIFALAPQPLLIRLGTLLGDIYPTDVYQLKREPTTWAWLEDDTSVVKYRVNRPTSINKIVALKLSLSGSISDNSVTEILGKCSIWEITHVTPHNDFIRKKEHLQYFRFEIRKLFEKIQQVHGSDTTIHVFPAMPVSSSVEFGRVWMPKAHPQMVIYDLNKSQGGFIKAIAIENP